MHNAARRVLKGKNMISSVSRAALAVALLLPFGSAPAQTAAPENPTAAQAEAFLTEAEDRLTAESLDASRVQWINSTYITVDSDALAASSGARWTELGVRNAIEASRYARAPDLSADTRRKLDMLRSGLTLAAPTTAGSAEELSTISTGLQSRYGKGKGTLRGQPINGSDIEEAMGTERDPALLQEMWTSWNDGVGAPMRQDYARMVDIANKGAQELGYADTGAMWRSKYDMPADEFAKMMDRLWGEVKPLYDALHCYTRDGLNQKYGEAVQPANGPIRADLLGNMWAQSWGNVYDIVAPKGAGDLGYDIGEQLKARGDDPVKMVKIGEGFYGALGLPALPQTFWERSQITKPLDREVVCHASAWDIDAKDDIRIKMCTKVNSEDFVTIHHELGHNYYQRAYQAQSYLHRDGANDGFHEAIGDFVALSITPDYLVKIGLLGADKVPAADKDIGLLLRQAMDKVAFLPFGLLIDKWRWGVFDGSIAPTGYQKAWDDLRLRYQGVVPPVTRDESKFDAGGKYHIPGNTPYARYFLAHLLQFQFYEAACKDVGWKGPLHRCSFYGSEKVGKKLDAMLHMGASRPWQEALQRFTGSREISGRSINRYFAPLKQWLDKENKGKQCGW